MTKRTDVHRPGAIIPAHYRYVLSYNLATTVAGWPIPSMGVNCTSEKLEHHPSGQCCVVAMRKAGLPFAATGATGKCSVCGANYVYGDVWVHEPTGEHIHIGHDCARKYELLADRSAWELAHERVKAAAAREVVKAQNREARERFLAQYPGLEGVLSMDHHILRDMADRFHRFLSLSPKQVEFAFKLAAEMLFPAPVEAHVPAPEGRVRFQGTVVSLKLVESDFGLTTKVTVKVAAENGVWLAWGTLPSSLSGVQRGDTVALTAALARGRDAHFAFFKRPTKGEVIESVAAQQDEKLAA